MCAGIARQNALRNCQKVIESAFVPNDNSLRKSKGTGKRPVTAHFLRSLFQRGFILFRTVNLSGIIPYFSIRSFPPTFLGLRPTGFNWCYPFRHFFASLCFFHFFQLVSRPIFASLKSTSIPLRCFANLIKSARL